MLKSAFGGQEGFQMPPEGPRNPQKWPRRGLKWPQIGPREAQEPPRAVQERPRTPLGTAPEVPGAAQKARSGPSGSQEGQLGATLEPTWSKFGPPGFAIRPRKRGIFQAVERLPLEPRYLSFSCGQSLCKHAASSAPRPW